MLIFQNSILLQSRGETKKIYDPPAYLIQGNRVYSDEAKKIIIEPIHYSPDMISRLIDITASNKELFRSEMKNIGLDQYYCVTLPQPIYSVPVFFPRKFIERVFLQNDRKKFDPSFTDAVEELAGQINKAIDDGRLPKSGFKTNIRIPVESMKSEAVGVDNDIKEYLPVELEKKIMARGIKIEVSLVSMSFSALSGFIEKEMDADKLKAWIMKNASDKDGNNLFNWMDVIYSSGIDGLKSALAKMGDNEVYFANHSESKEITKCYDKLRNVVLCPNQSYNVSVNPKEKVFEVQFGPEMTALEFEDLKEHYANKIFYIRHEKEDGGEETIRCELRKPPGGMETPNTLVFSQPGMDPSNLFHLMPKNGSALEFKNSPEEPPFYKAVLAVKGSDEKDE